MEPANENRRGLSRLTFDFIRPPGRRTPMHTDLLHATDGMIIVAHTHRRRGLARAKAVSAQLNAAPSDAAPAAAKPPVDANANKPPTDSTAAPKKLAPDSVAAAKKPATDSTAAKKTPPTPPKPPTI